MRLDFTICLITAWMVAAFWAAAFAPLAFSEVSDVDTDFGDKVKFNGTFIVIRPGSDEILRGGDVDFGYVASALSFQFPIARLRFGKDTTVSAPLCGGQEMVVEKVYRLLPIRHKSRRFSVFRGRCA